jgi:HD superfamily phosphodiesterase
VLMAAGKFNPNSIIEARFPGLINKIRETIQELEWAYEGKGKHTESMLWEHTQHVAAISYQLARAEHIDPLLPTIAALFHDAGKFAEGKYHKDETIEEEESAHIAERILPGFGMKSSGIRQILAGLKALYNEKAHKNRIAAILHDADFLSKFGALGVAAFFTKSVLRGRTLQSSLLGYLSKELTYGSSLPMNMHTAAGKKLAVKKAADSLKFFRSLLAELRESGIANLQIGHMQIPSPAHNNRFLKIQLVNYPLCPKCGSKWRKEWTTEKGVKCIKLMTEWICTQCGERQETSFCLPEI